MRHKDNTEILQHWTEQFYDVRKHSVAKVYKTTATNTEKLQHVDDTPQLDAILNIINDNSLVTSYQASSLATKPLILTKKKLEMARLVVSCCCYAGWEDIFLRRRLWGHWNSCSNTRGILFLLRMLKQQLLCVYFQKPLIFPVFFIVYNDSRDHFSLRL